MWVLPACTCTNPERFPFVKQVNVVSSRRTATRSIPRSVRAVAAAEPLVRRGGVHSRVRRYIPRRFSGRSRPRLRRAPSRVAWSVDPWMVSRTPVRGPVGSPVDLSFAHTCTCNSVTHRRRRGDLCPHIQTAHADTSADQDAPSRSPARSTTTLQPAPRPALRRRCTLGMRLGSSRILKGSTRSRSQSLGA